MPENDDEIVQLLAAALEAGGPPKTTSLCQRRASVAAHLPSEAAWKDMAKTCSTCGTVYHGRQKYYPGYEGHWVAPTMATCPMCFCRDLPSYFHNVYSFELEDVTATVSD